MVQMRREAADLFQVHTLVQAIRTADDDDPKDVQKALKSFMFAKSPFLKKDIEKQDIAMVEEMRSWTKHGPIEVQPQPSPVQQIVQSRLLGRKKA